MYKVRRDILKSFHCFAIAIDTLPFLMPTYLYFRVRILEPSFSTLFIVWVRFRLYLSYDVSFICMQYYESKLHLKSDMNRPS